MKFVFILTALLLIPRFAMAGDPGFAWLALYDLSKVYFIPLVLVQLIIFQYYLKNINTYKFGLWIAYLNALITYVIQPVFFLIWILIFFLFQLIVPEDGYFNFQLLDRFFSLPLAHSNDGILVVLYMLLFALVISCFFMTWIMKNVIDDKKKAIKVSIVANVVSYTIVLICILLVFNSGWYKSFEYLKPNTL